MPGTWFRSFVTGLTLLSFTACTTMQAVRDFSPSTIRGQVAVGDRVEILASNDMTYELVVQELGDTYLVGQADSGRRYKIQFEAIRELRTRQVNAAATVGGIGAGLYLVMIGLFIVLVNSLDDVFSGC